MVACCSASPPRLPLSLTRASVHPFPAAWGSRQHSKRVIHASILSLGGAVRSITAQFGSGLSWLQHLAWGWSLGKGQEWCWRGCSVLYILFFSQHPNQWWGFSAHGQRLAKLAWVVRAEDFRSWVGQIKTVACLDLGTLNLILWLLKKIN